MFFKQISVEGMGCLSYLIGCPQAGIACVVDPKRDVQDYINLARKNDMKITHIFETHLHADHVSGNLELKSRTGADIYLKKGSPATFDFKPLSERDIFEFGSVKLEIIETPGHTPGCLSYLVTDKSRGDEPWLVLSGDCLFVGDIGRPDLAGKEMIGEQVENLYNSLYNKLGKLRDELEVFPSHGEGSLCGKGMSSKLCSTIGFEKKNNPLLSLSKDEFIKQMGVSFPERPKSFTHIISTNWKGAPLLENCRAAGDLMPFDVRKLLDKGAVLLDTRDTASFGGVHIPGSINIGFANQTANSIGMVINPEVDLILLVTDEAAYNEMLIQLHRIGYDKVLGYLYGGITYWQEAGYPVEQLCQISAAQLKSRLDSKSFDHFFDVRTETEKETGYIKGSEHLPITKLLGQPLDIPKDKEIAITCGMGYRGNIAASLLQSQGFQHVYNLAGGMKAWVNSGYDIET